jgi:hypothetical protein
MWIEPEQLRARLLPHQASLRSMGVIRLAVFGSRMREDWRPDSDLDLLVDLDPAARISLIGFERLRRYLSELLGVRVDLTERDCLRPRLRASIGSDEQPVFEAA